MELKGKKIAVLGLGAVGLSLIRALAKAGAQVAGLGYENPAENARIEAELKKINVKTVFHPIAPDGLMGFDYVVMAPFGGMHLEAFEYASQHGKTALNDLDFIFPFLRGKIIGVTGTCGKSTTVAMIAAMLKNQGLKVSLVGGDTLDWGRPILDPKDYDYHLLEVGSSRLEGTQRFRPHIAVLLNIFPAHGERHGGSLVKYVEAKAKIFSSQGPEDYLVIDADAANVQELVRQKKAQGRRVQFSLSNQLDSWGVYRENEELVWAGADGERLRFSLAETKIGNFPTRAMDAMAAIAVAKLCGVEDRNIQKALVAYRPLPGRLHRVRKLDGVTFIDDSQSNNIGAAIWALNSFTKPILWIAGGDSVYGSRLNTLPRHVLGKVKQCIVIGSLAAEIADLFREKIPVVVAGDLPKAVEIANQAAEADEIVLFSPACPPDQANASAGLSRSKVFREAVKALQRTPRMLQSYRGFSRI